MLISVTTLCTHVSPFQTAAPLFAASQGSVVVILASSQAHAEKPATDTMFVAAAKSQRAVCSGVLHPGVSKEPKLFVPTDSRQLAKQVRPVASTRNSARPVISHS